MRDYGRYPLKIREENHPNHHQKKSLAKPKGNIRDIPHIALPCAAILARW